MVLLTWFWIILAIAVIIFIALYLISRKKGGKETPLEGSEETPEEPEI